MRKLQEYYCFFDMFKGKFNDDRFSKAGRLAFELRYVRKQYAEFQPIDTTKMIGYTFVDTTFDKLDECVIIDKL